MSDVDLKFTPPYPAMSPIQVLNEMVASGRRIRELEQYVAEFESCAKAIENVFGTVTWPSKSLRSVIDRWKGVAPELTPRVLEGDWETVRDALDALPEGAVIKWADSDGCCVALKSSNAMGKSRWFEAGYSHPRASESIARDETPIEVIA